MGRKPWSELSREDLEEERRKGRVRAKLRKMGKPATVPSPEPTRRWINKLHDEGLLSYAEIAALADLSGSTVSDIAKGHRGRGSANVVHRLPRSTQDAILAIPMPEQPNIYGHVMVDPVGSQRRLQALVYQGYTSYIMADLMGYRDHKMIWRLITGKAQRGKVDHRIHASTRTKISELYDKYRSVDPRDVGVSEIGVGRAKSTALRHGYAPWWTWDDDLIDNPEAFPEWTGACGTEEGYRIHIRESMFNGNYMPLCVPCRRTVEGRSAVPEFVWHPEKFRILVEKKGVSVRRVSIEADLSREMLYRWYHGTRNPRRFADIEQLARYFEVPVEELATVTTEEDIAAAPLVEGAFNRHIFAVALDLKGLSFSEAARLLDTSHTTISNWVHGRRSPEDPKRLINLARFLRAKPEEFWT